MSGYGSDIDNQPLRYWNGKAIYLTAYLALAFVAAIVLLLLLGSAGIPLGALMIFHPLSFRSGMLWQAFTWPFVNPLDFFTPFSILCFYFFGVEVEKYLGRRRLLWLCGLLTVVPVFYYSMFALAGSITPALSGVFLVSVGLLIAFATLYPDVEMFGWVPLKYFAGVCVACGSLTYFPAHNWAGLFLLWLECLVGFAFIQHARGIFELNFDLRRFWPRKKPNLRVLPRHEPARAVSRSTAIADEVDEAEAEIDALLDKIASSGLQSLSASEKARLEALRQRMLRKGS